MLQITVPDGHLYDEEQNLFTDIKGQTLQLEHSLLSLAKWEAKWRKPFLGQSERTVEECADYIRCMTLTKNVDPLVYSNIPTSEFQRVNDYIEDPMTATWFNEEKSRSRNHEVITAEIIYYWMISLNIPFECQKWHLNRLLALIRVCNVKNAPQKKMSKRDLISRNRALNEARRKRLNSKG